MMESNTVWVISIRFLWLTSMSSSGSSLAGSTSNLTDLKKMLFVKLGKDFQFKLIYKFIITIIQSGVRFASFNTNKG